MACRRQPFTHCRLYIDGADGLVAGDYILTSGGSAYLVQATRPSPSRPERLYRGHLTTFPRVPDATSSTGIGDDGLLSGKGGLLSSRARSIGVQHHMRNPVEGLRFGAGAGSWPALFSVA